MADWSSPVEITQSRDKAIGQLRQVQGALSQLKSSIATWKTWYVKVKQAIDAGELELKPGEAAKYLEQYNALVALETYLIDVVGV